MRIDRAKLNEEKYHTLLMNYKWITNSKNSEKCVFISHKSEDKEACIQLREYLWNAGLEVYLDCYDEGLQIASEEEDLETVTKYIKKGIQRSTHMLCVISKNTVESKWVPFEIGYGHADLVDKDDNQSSQKWRVSILKLENVSRSELPEYLQIAPDIKGVKGLNKYVAEVLNTNERKLLNENRILDPTMNLSRHPLKGTLNLNY